MTVVKDLSAADADQMAHLHAQVFDSAAAWQASAFQDLLALASTRAIGAWRDERLAAFLVAQFVTPEAEILTIATEPSFQRQGLANSLVEHLENELQKQGLEKWLLEVAADNHRAVAFYEKIGFQRDGRRPEYYKRLEGSRIDAILMSKPLARQETN